MNNNEIKLMKNKIFLNSEKIVMIITLVSTLLVTSLLMNSCSTTDDLTTYHHHKSYNKQVKCYNFTN